MKPGIRPLKRLGQCFLKDPSVARRIVEAAGIQGGDRVIEIGPGDGALTAPLLETPLAELLAVELDLRLIARLTDQFSSDPRFRLVHADFLRWTFPETGGKPWRVVGNIPYGVTSPLLFRLWEKRISIKRATLMVQKEVAQRLTAKPHGKAYGIPSVLFQLYAEVTLRFIVPRGAFRPTPGVDSAVITLDFLDAPRVPIADEADFIRFIRQIFGQRRKMLRNTLRPLFGDGFPDTLSDRLTARPESLSPEALVDLYHALRNQKAASVPDPNDPGESPWPS